MNKKPLLRLQFCLVVLGLMIMPSAKAQSAFSNAVMSLNPVAYWPLQETVQPPAADVETNLGSLGAAANAYYSSTNVTKGAAPIPGDSSDFAVACSATAAGSFLAVPTTTGAAFLPAGPFTVEVWVNPTNVSASQTIIAQTGPAGSGGLGGSANSAGWSLNVGYVPSLNATVANSITFHVYNGNGFAGGAEASYASPSFTPGSWYHIVGVFDGTNALLEVNDVAANSFQPIDGTEALDTWDELTIGCGRGLNNNKFGGSIDEVAIYTNVLSGSQITAHYNAGVGGGNYESTILADHPYMYWRMDAPGHTTPDFSAYPTAFNYGTGLNLDGLYLAGTTPGAAGPNYPGLGSPSYACAFNGIGTDDTNAIPSYTNGVLFATNTAAQSGIIITNLLDSMNLVTNSMTYMCWFKENPSDQHRGVLIGHSDKAWRTSMDPNHVTANTGKGGDLSSSPLTYNDGNWHFAVIVYNNSGVPTNTTGWIATNYVYVDGLLTASALITNANAAGSFTNVTIGVPPDKSSGNGNTYNSQVLAGSIAQVAFFNYALTSDQIVNLYTNATQGPLPAPVITGQPITGRTNGAAGNNGSGPGSYIFMGVQYAGATSLQWYFNSSSNYAGATALTSDNVKYVGTTTGNMTISNLVDSDSGYYYVVLNNAYGSTTSILASFTVVAEPYITAQTPAGGTLQLYQNQNYTLSVTSGGETNFAYQWYTNGVADTTAGTNATYSLISVQPAMSGTTYQCIVQNSFGYATNDLVTLSVLSLPSAITSSPYATNILALNPTVYFPMHETAPAAAADIETNYGTLGAVADGTYADWNINNGFPDDQVIRHGITGAIANDPDPAEQFNFHGNTNSYLLVPHTSPGTTLIPPFSIEAWVKGTGTGFGDIVSEDGTTLNTGNANNKYGIRLSWGGNIQVYVGSYPGPTASQTLSFFQWHHVVLTCDTNNSATNYTLYVDGSQVSTISSGFIPDSWDPLTIGNGMWNASGPTRAAANLSVDEVAIYGTNLDSTTIYNHYNDGINGAAGQYVADVTSLNPLMYYRMDRSTYTVPDSSTWPVMTNYGTVGGNGVYTPGLAPGSIAGPNNGSGLFAASLSGTNAAPMNGMSTYAAAYNPNAFNVIGATTPLSFSMWFKSNPSDARYQALVSQGPGWQMAQQVNGTLQFYLGGTYVNSKTVCNDGNWHHVVVTYSNRVGNFFVDGAFDSTGTNAALTNPPPTTAWSTCIGCDPRYTGANQTSGVGRQYAGNICEFAFWNGTALTAGQVQSLYNSANAAPLITQQPISASVNARSIFTNSVTVIGSAPLSYQWYRDGLALPTAGQTNLATGATNASLVFDPVKSTDASTDYYVVISNGGGSVTSSVVSLTVFTQPVFTNEPVLITQTNNIQLFAGATPTFQAGAVGAQPTYYQWFTNDVAVTPQGTNVTSVTLSAQPGLTFYCVASNFVGSTTSAPVSMTILPDPTAPYPAAVLAANPIGYWRLDETNAVGNYNISGQVADDYWGGYNGIYSNSDLGVTGYSSTDPDTAVQFGIHNFDDSDVYSIGGIDFSSASNSVTFSIEAWVNGYTQTTDAGIVSKGYGNGGEQFNLDTGSTKNHCFRFFVRDASGATHGASSLIAPNSSWHHLVGVCDEVNSNVTLYVDGVVAASASISPGSGIQTSDRSMLIGARPPNSTSNNTNQFVGTIDDVAVYNRALTASEIGSHYATAGAAPNLTQAPSTNVTVGGFNALTLPVMAVGTPVISYTWYDTLNNTNVATGSTNGDFLDATLNVASVPPAWNGDTLELTVQNTYGTTNFFVTLNVLTNAPQFTLDLPPQVQVVSGKSYTYSIAVLGAQPVYLQWYNGATLLANQTNSTYSLVAGNPGSTTYYVVATNAFGATTSTISTFTSIAQLSGYAYATNVLALNPVGYWPLQETNAQAAATIETNYGLLGAAGNAYYAITNADPLAVHFNQTGALTGSGDNDPAVFFSGYAPTGSAGCTNEASYAFVPRTTPALTIVPPMTAECWFYANGVGREFGDLFGEGGGTGLNAADGLGNWGGFRVSYGGNGTTNLELWVANGNGTTRNSVASPANSLPVGSWHHCVVSYDGTTVIMYIDGVPQVTNSTSLAGANTMNPDTWSPFTIGGAFWHNNGLNRAIYATLDEVAVYSNILSAGQVLNHYQIGTGAVGGNYMQTIINDKPLLYYRMDCLGYTNPPETTCPEAVNYGSAVANGFYLSGVAPGAVTGPTNSILGTNAVAAPINGVISCVDAGSDPSFNPSGNQSFTAMTWFRTYPSDDRAETIMSHGETNWAMNIDGTTGKLVWNLFSSGSQVTSSTILNDGNWHFVAGVYDGSTSNSYLYVDGQLDSSVTLTNAVNSEPNAHLYLGGNPDFTTLGGGQRYFGGALAQAAFFTSALSSSQIQSLFAGAIGQPSNPSTNATITGFLLSGTNLVVRGTNNNTPNTSYHYVVLTSTNLAAPLSNWNMVVTGAFNPDGTFDYTNPITPGTPRQFIDVKAVP